MASVLNIFRINQEGYAPGLPVYAAALTKEPVLLKNAAGETIRRITFDEMVKGCQKNVTLNLKESTSSSLLQLRVWDVETPLNPLIKESVKNNTFIEQDF